jgi:hypothetical protein
MVAYLNFVLSVRKFSRQCRRLLRIHTRAHHPDVEIHALKQAHTRRPEAAKHQGDAYYEHHETGYTDRDVHNGTAHNYNTDFDTSLHSPVYPRAWARATAGPQRDGTYERSGMYGAPHAAYRDIAGYNLPARGHGNAHPGHDKYSSRDESLHGGHAENMSFVSNDAAKPRSPVHGHLHAAMSPVHIGRGIGGQRHVDDEFEDHDVGMVVEVGGVRMHWQCDVQVRAWLDLVSLSRFVSVRLPVCVCVCACVGACACMI